MQGVKINKEEVRLRETAVKYMGHILSYEGLKPDPAKVDVIVGMICPSRC